MMQIGLIVVVAIVLAACWFGFKHLKAVYERQSLLSSRIVFLESLLQDDEPASAAPAYSSSSAAAAGVANPQEGPKQKNEDTPEENDKQNKQD